jgi:hypothetical protein
MIQCDIRLFDRDNPNTAPEILKEIKKSITDASDKFETFLVTHEPIKLKSKLAVRKKTTPSKAYTPQVEAEEEIIDEDYTDDDDDGLDL